MIPGSSLDRSTVHRQKGALKMQDQKMQDQEMRDLL